MHHVPFMSQKNKMEVDIRESPFRKIEGKKKRISTASEVIGNVTRVSAAEDRY